MIDIRDAVVTDLPAINTVIDAAIKTWDLPARVIRLSLPSYHYNESDLQHLSMIVAEQDNCVIAVAAWEKADIYEVDDDINAALLHGIYVAPEFQSKGVGRQLFNHVEKVAMKAGYESLIVKAQKQANGFS